ncbi:hypothetical protein K438DRAFT_1798743 [Mycena galopus ATCC 62051]|nr:hypothetical protein K438DRAFT_1798743 [Mycena galopus ATCC 62051]
MHPGARRHRGPGKRGRALGAGVTARLQRLGRKPCSPRAPRHLRKPGGVLGEARPQPPVLRCDDDDELTSTKSVDSKTLPPLTSQRLRLRPSLDSLSTSRPLARQGRRRRRARSLVRVQRGRHQRRRGSFPHRPFAASGSSVPGLSPTSPRVFTDTVPLISSPLAAFPQATRNADTGRPSSSTSPTSPRTLAVAVAVAASARARMRTAADARPVGLPRRRRTTGE